MKKPLGHKSKLQTILTIGRPIIILALALIMAVSVVAPAHAFVFLGILGVYWIAAGIIALIGGAIAAAVAYKAQILEVFGTATGIILLDLLKLLIGILQPLLAPVLIVLIGFGLRGSTVLLNDPVANQLWATALGVANATFLFVLLIASIAIILRINTGIYNLKKFLGGFIIAVALANFSLIIVKTMVALGDQLVNVAIGLGEALGVDLIAGVGSITYSIPLPDGSTMPVVVKDSIDSILAYFIGMLNMNISFVEWTTDSMIQATMEMIIFLITAWVVAKLAFILLERIVRLFAAAIMAPLIFAGSLLPNFQKKAQEWWENTIKWILVLPITIAFIMISLKFFALGGITSPVTMSELNTKLAPNILVNMQQTAAAAGSTASTEEVRDLLYIMIGMFVLWTAGTISNKFDLKSVMGGLVDTPQKTLALGQKALAQGQRMYRTAADTVTGKNWIGRQGAKIKGAVLAGKGLGGISLGKDASGKDRGTVGDWLAKQEAARRTTRTRWGFDEEANKSMGETAVQTKQATKARTDANASLSRLDDRAKTLTGYEDYAALYESNPTKAALLAESDPVMAKELKTLKALGKEATFFNKKTRLDLDQLDPPSTYEEALKSGDTEKIQTAYEALKTHARNKNNPGYEKAAELIEQYRGDIAKGLGMTDKAMVWSPKQRKEGEYEKKATSGSIVSDSTDDSDTALLRHQEQDARARTDLKAISALGDSEIDAIVSGVGDSAAATAKKSALDDAGPIAIPAIKSLAEGTDEQQKRLNAALKEKDKRKRRTILTGDSSKGGLGITDEATLKTIDALANDEDTAWDAKGIQGRIAVISNVGAGASKVEAVIDQIRQLQTAAASAKSIEANQQQKLQQALNNYQTTVQNMITAAGGGTVTLNTAGITGLGTPMSVNNSSSANSAANQILAQLTAQLKSNPTLISGGAKLSSLSGGPAQANAVMAALQQLGIGMGTKGSAVSIDEALKHLRTLTKIK